MDKNEFYKCACSGVASADMPEWEIIESFHVCDILQTACCILHICVILLHICMIFQIASLYKRIMHIKGLPINMFHFITHLSALIVYPNLPIGIDAKLTLLETTLMWLLPYLGLPSGVYTKTSTT